MDDLETEREAREKFDQFIKESKRSIAQTDDLSTTIQDTLELMTDINESNPDVFDSIVETRKYNRKMDQ
jgi:hypothetical protein